MLKNIIKSEIKTHKEIFNYFGGEKNQIEKLSEEINELEEAISDYYSNNESYKPALQLEMADVFNILLQFYVTDPGFRAASKMKLARTKERIKSDYYKYY